MSVRKTPRRSKWATKGIERDLALLWRDRIGRQGDQRRVNMTDAEVEALVERAVQG